MCWEKSCDKTFHMLPNSWQDVTNGLTNFVTNHLNFASGRVDMMSQNILGRVDVMSQVTNCPLEAGVDEKYVEGLQYIGGRMSQ
jgi:hypothetical protein